MTRLHSLFVIFCAVLIVSCGAQNLSATKEKEAWNARNDPARFGAESQHYLSIPTEAALPFEESPWSAGYWPTYRGGIANRWQTSDAGTDYRSYLFEPLTPAAAAALTEAEIDALSPAEKLDLFLGRTDFPLVQQQQAKTRAAVRDGYVPSWFGLCHGWAAAAVAEQLPAQDVVVTDNQNRNIRFRPLDIAGLASALYGELLFPTRVSGARCNTADPVRDARGRVTLSHCRDVNPATMHLHLAKFLHDEGKSFIADFYFSDQVWNFPIRSYEFSYSDLRAFTAGDEYADVRAPGTAFLVDVTMIVAHAPLIASNLHPRQGLREEVEFQYTLELDANEFIIGGEWKTDNYPDFLWTVDAVPQRNGNPHLNIEVIRELLSHSAM